MSFEWDPNKEIANLSKHRISFELASRIFTDPFAWSEQDRIENNEYRWKTIGMIDGILLLVVAHTVEKKPDNTERIRIISARRAEPKERKNYEQRYR